MIWTIGLVACTTICWVGLVAVREIHKTADAMRARTDPRVVEALAIVARFLRWRYRVTPAAARCVVSDAEQVVDRLVRALTGDEYESWCQATLHECKDADC